MGRNIRDRKSKSVAAPPTLLEPGARLPRPYQGLLLLMVLLLAALAVRQVDDPDVGFHLKAGSWILSGHGWPHNDPFTYTLNTHPYTDTTWGYQVLLTLANQVAGAPGMVMFHLMILMGLFYLLYKTTRLVPVDAATLTALLGAGIVAGELRYNIRPELLSFLFLAALLYVLHRHALGLKTPLWLLPLLLGVWANVHALFALGWIALVCVAAGLWIRDRRPDRKLLLWSGAALVAPLVNPYGIRGVLFPLSLLSRFQAGNVFAESIGEFASPFALHVSDSAPFYPHWPVWTFRLLVVLAGVALIALLKRRLYGAALLCLVFVPLSAKMVRNMPLLVVVALPVMIWALPASGLWRLLGMRMRRARAAGRAAAVAAGLLAVVLGLRVVTDAYYIAARRPERFGWGWNRGILPVEAAAYVKRMGLPGPMFNHLTFGGYLMWALPQKVFIDGRLEMTGETFYTEYDRILHAPEALEPAVERYGFRWIILPYMDEPELLERLSHDSHWALAYVDAVAAVFARQGPDAARWVDQASGGRSAPVAPEVRALPGLGGPPRPAPPTRWLRGLFARERYPLEEYDRAVFHHTRNEYAQAEAWYRAALARGGADYYEIYLNMGACLLNHGKYDEAALCFEAVLREDSDNPAALQNAAVLARARAGAP